MIHLRLFSSTAYRHESNQLRNKLDDKGEQMILAWYHSTGFYKLYNEVNMIIVISRDAIFDEIK